MDPLSILDKSLRTANQLQSIAKSIKDVEFKTLLAELYNDLADAKLELSALKFKIVSLEEENRHLKEKREISEKPKLMNGSYYFENDPQAYCVACYETKVMKAPMDRINPRLQKCLVCKESRVQGSSSVQQIYVDPHPL